MNFHTLKQKLQTGLKPPLPGSQAQLIMAPSGRPMPDVNDINLESVKKAAVLALFYEQSNSAQLVLTLRKKYQGVHSNQISFPGGKRDNTDPDFRFTALREAEEEIGISPSSVDIYGELSPLYIPPSNFLVHPFVGIYNDEPSFVKQETEVEHIFSVDVIELLDDTYITTAPLLINKTEVNVPAFSFKGYTVWGATAMMLSELRQVLLSK